MITLATVSGCRERFIFSFFVSRRLLRLPRNTFSPIHLCEANIGDSPTMSQKNRKNKNRLPPFLPLLKDMLDAPACWALSHGAFRLYVALKREYNLELSDRRNGRIYLSLRRAQQEIRSDRAQIARWYRELEHYGFIVMTTPGGLEGKGKAPRWRLTELGYMNDPPTKDFLRWKGGKFRDQTNQNPGREIPTTLAGKSRPPLAGKSLPLEAESGREIPAKGEGGSGREIPAITKSHHLVGPQIEPDAPETVVVPMRREPRS
jgi:hypothetical protein